MTTMKFVSLDLSRSAPGTTEARIDHVLVGGGNGARIRAPSNYTISFLDGATRDHLVANLMRVNLTAGAVSLLVRQRSSRRQCLHHTGSRLHGGRHGSIRQGYLAAVAQGGKPSKGRSQFAHIHQGDAVADIDPLAFPSSFSSGERNHCHDAVTYIKKTQTLLLFDRAFCMVTHKRMTTLAPSVRVRASRRGCLAGVRAAAPTR
jgi:hypothetical protein